MKKANIISIMLSAAIACSLFCSSACAETNTAFTHNTKSEYSISGDQQTDYHFKKSDREGYELYRCTYQQNAFYDEYFKFTNNYRGIYEQYEQDYRYAFVTASPDADIDKLSSILGEKLNNENVIYFPVAENQLAYKYSENIDYESLYDIAGVEKVELLKSCFKSEFERDTHIITGDEWGKETGYDKGCPENLMMSEVITKNGVKLTADMFADTGFTVEHVYQKDDDTWYVYFDYNGIESYTDFDLNAEKIDGVVSSSINVITYVSDKSSFVSDTVSDNSKIPAVIKGDISGNGEVDLYDAIEIAKYLIHSRDFTDEEFEIADFNSDGKVDLYDAIGIAETFIN